MKICMIAEGSYPYVTGGVSSWIHTLTTAMPEKQFIIYAIAAERKLKGKFKYTIPKNVEIFEVFLDAHVEQGAKWGKRFSLTKEQNNSLFALISSGENIDWAQLFHLIRSDQFQNVGNFLSSKNYFDLIQQLAETKYTQVPFTELFWTVSSMLIPLFLIIQQDVPKADVYHAVSTGYAGVVGALAKILYNKPLLLTEHGIYSREREEEIIKASWVKGYFKDLWINYFYTLAQSIYELSNEVITLFGKNKEIEIELGCNEKKIRIIPNGIETVDFAQVQRTLAEDRIRLGGIVRVVPIKDIKMMIQMFALVERKIPTAELYIMGPTEEDTKYYKECMELVQLLHVKNIIFTGMVQIKEYLGNMDILLLTSVSEGQPLAILEGFACSKPFVCTNVGGCSELINGRDDDIGPAGYVVPVMHYEEMAELVIKLCENEALRKEMGLNALKRVSQYYRKTDFIKQYRVMYEQWGGVT